MHFQVCSVNLYGNGRWNYDFLTKPIPIKLREPDETTKLCFFIATQVETLLRERHAAIWSFFASMDDLKANPGQAPLSLGLLFNVSDHQTGIALDALQRWNDIYSIGKATGHNLCTLLQEELDLLDLPIKVTTPVDNATAITMLHNYKVPPGPTPAVIGIAIGDSTVGAYLKRFSSSLGEDRYKLHGVKLVGADLGSLDDRSSVLPSTTFDVKLDEASPNPGRRMLDKLTANKYIGELFRSTLLHMQQDPKIRLFNEHQFPNASKIAEQPPLAGTDREPSLQKAWSVNSKALFAFEAKKPSDWKAIQALVQIYFDIPRTRVSAEDAQIVQEVAHAIGKRTARLVGMALGVLVLKRGRIGHSGESVNVAISSAAMRDCPNFERYMRAAMRSMDEIGERGEGRIQIGMVDDEPVIGAAIAALLAG